MTTPPAGPVWLDVDDVKAYLRITDTSDDDLIARAAAAVEVTVQRCRPDRWDEFTDVPEPRPDPVYDAGPEVYQAAVALAARLYRRRNSPGGIETLADNALYVARFDPEIERALHIGSWAMPGVG